MKFNYNGSFLNHMFKFAMTKYTRKLLQTYKPHSKLQPLPPFLGDFLSVTATLDKASKLLDLVAGLVGHLVPQSQSTFLVQCSDFNNQVIQVWEGLGFMSSKPLQHWKYHHFVGHCIGSIGLAVLVTNTMKKDTFFISNTIP